ncbi:cytidylate kinase family protein [Bariatricus sp. HCP28S3_C2]|uniref:cytidylate kinase family protein n=1 Tax=unclassified Bariatricus TaxID=2677046 RepID=UPI003F8CD556
MILMFVKLILVVILAFLAGKLISKLKLPAILGWLIAGMLLGPHAFSLMNQEILDAGWYQVMIHVLECGVGLMIGTELVWNKIKKSGKAIVITTLTQSLGTFLVVSLVFGVVFYITDVPLYLCFVFGGIALATAPAPALSIVREFKTDGPVTKTLIPMAALDDIVGCVVFFTTIAVIAGKLSAGSMPAYMIALVVILPLVIGIVCGFLSGFILRRDNGDGITLALLIVIILFTSVAGFFFNNRVMPTPILNFMLMGMAFSATFSNMMSENRLEQIMRVFKAVYILSRALGKYFGAYFGAAVTKSPQTVKKYLGFTLLPHSGVSLVFTGIAVSVLSGSAPECAQIIQGTIAAAAVINEIIAVIMAKKGFEWAGELNQSGADNALEEKASAPLVITISRQYGSGGRDIAMKLSKDLGIPFYDKEIIEMAAQTSSIERSFFENYETDKSNKVLNELASNVTNHYSLDDRVFEHNVKTIRRIAETLLTQSHPAVMATNPAREPLKVMDTSGLP